MSEPKIVNVNDVQPSEQSHGERFAIRVRSLGFAAGAQKLGANVAEIPPGKTAFPYHFHMANEEALFVLEGEGSLRTGDRTLPLKAGDFVSFPPGPPAHQVTAGPRGLKLFQFSTAIVPEVAVYPDSKKTAVLVRPKVPAEPLPPLRAVFPDEGQVDYWSREDY